MGNRLAAVFIATVGGIWLLKGKLELKTIRWKLASTLGCLARARLISHLAATDQKFRASLKTIEPEYLEDPLRIIPPQAAECYIDMVRLAEALLHTLNVEYRGLVQS